MASAMRLVGRLFLATLAPLWIVGAAHAAPCAGFADLDAADPFCASVTWLKNEGITLGCGDGSIYCPQDPVSRLQMAAFLKRFADATGDAATAQPYAYTLAASCFLLNVCQANFPAVPAGKRLRLTGVRAHFQGTSVNGAFVVNRNFINNPLASFPVAPFDGGGYGTLLAANQTVDLIFAAGEIPVLELNVATNPSGIAFHPNNRFGVTGYLVDVLP